MSHLPTIVCPTDSPAGRLCPGKTTTPMACPRGEFVNGSRIRNQFDPSRPFLPCVDHVCPPECSARLVAQRQSRAAPADFPFRTASHRPTVARFARLGTRAHWAPRRRSRVKLAASAPNLVRPHAIALGRAFPATIAPRAVPATRRVFAVRPLRKTIELACMQPSRVYVSQHGLPLSGSNATRPLSQLKARTIPYPVE